MIVIIAQQTPSAIRGLLKRWFIEPKPNVFVGSLNARTREKVLDYIRRNAPGLSMMVIFDDQSSQGFKILTYGDPDRQVVRRSGLEMILENPEALQNGSV